MKKFASVGIAAVTAVTMTGVFTPAQAQTVDINSLLAQIAQLTALVSQLQAAQGGNVVSTSYTFTQNLTLGSKGAEVKTLQQYLNANGAQVAATGAGSPGNESTYFGPATKAALAKWQAAHGVTPASGYFGALTRAKIVSLGGGVSTGGGVVVVPTESFLKVESMLQSAASLPSGSLYNKVLTLKLTAGKDGATVTGVTVTRGGYVENTKITGVSLWDDAGTRYGNIITALTADGKATISFSGSPIVLGAGQSKSLYVAINIDSTVTSGTVNFSVVSASDVAVSNSVPVQGTFPVTGTTFSLVDGSASLGNVYLDDQAVSGLSSTSGDGNIEVGQTDREIYKLQLNQSNSKEAVRLEKITFYGEGTIRDTDLKNWKLYSPEGNVLATAEKMADRYVTFVLTTPYTIDKGLSKTLSVKADVADGSGYYTRLSIQNDYDVVVKGVTTGGAIQPKDSAGNELTQSDTQYTNGYFKVKAGLLTVSKAAGSPSGSVAPSSQNVVLAKFDLKSAGEKLEIRKMGLQISYDTTSGAKALTGTVNVKDATTGETYLSISADTTGLQATSTVTTTTMDTYLHNLSSYITVEAGATKTIEVTGTISSSAASTDDYTAKVGRFYTKRISTNDFTYLADSVYSGNQVTVGDVTLTVTKNAAFANTNRAKSATGVKVAEFVLQASSADDVRINSISFDVASSSYIQNLKLMDGTTQLGSTIGTPSASSNSFTTNFTIAKSQSKVLSLYADVLSSATNNDGFQVSVASAGVSGYGVNSSKSLSSTPSAALALQTITVKAPSLTIAADSSKPTSKIVLAGQTGVELNKIRFEASNEDLTLRKITLQLLSASSTGWKTATSTAPNFSMLYLYDGSTLLQSASVNSVTGKVLFALDASKYVTLPQSQQKTLTLKTDISGSGILEPTSVVAVMVNSSSTSDMEVYSSQGQLAEGSVTVTSSSTSNYFLFHDAAPTITNALSNATGKIGQATDVVGKFTVANSAPAGGRTLTLESFAVVASLSLNSSTSSAVTNFRLYDEADQLVATSAAATIYGASVASSTATITFASTSGAWVTQEIGAGASKTYTIKADTSNIESAVSNAGTTNTTLSLKVDGTKGYLSTDSTTGPEYYWNTGGVIYRYTQATTNTVFGTNYASDSYPVDGATLSY